MPLPPGLALNPATGQIVGTPTTPGTYNFTLRVRDAQGSLRDIPQSIVINAYTPPSLSGTLPQFANRTAPYSGGFSVSGGTAPFSWSISSGVLPAGISINPSTGAITGTPTDTNYTDRSITVRVVDALGSAAQRRATIRYADVLALSGSLATGTQGSSYSSGFTRSGGHSPFTFSLIAGSLPPGLSLNSSTGDISGTPTTTFSGSITVRVTDASGATADRSQTLTINSSYVPVSFSGSITGGTQDVETLSSFSVTPNYSGLSVSGGSGPITYSWTRISGSSAISAGSPSSLATSFVGTVSPSSSVSATFRVTATDGISSDTRDVTITVNNTYVAMSLSAAGLPLATRTVPYGSGVSRSGGKAPYTFSVISGTLPAGIVLSATTGTLTGTPTDTNYTNRSLTFRVTDALGATADASGSIGYRNFPSFTFSPVPAMRTRPYSYTLVPSNQWHSGSFSIASGSLPTGISFNGITGEFSGTPTDTSHGPRTITLRFVDAAGNISDSEATLAYADNLVISGTLPGGQQGVAYSSSALSASGGHGGNVWSIASGSLPSGLSLNSSTGEVAGTPTVSGTFSFTVRVTDSAGFTADSPQSISLAAGVSVSGSYTGSGTSGVSYSSTGVSASGGTPPYTWTVNSGSLPPGLSLDSSTGALTGTPTTAGSYSFTVRATDSVGGFANSASQSITIGAAVSVSLNSSTANGFTGYTPPPAAPSTILVVTNPATVATASGGSGSYTYSWARISGSSAITADSPSSSSTTFRGTVPAGLTTAVFRVTVTDTVTGQTATADVTVTLEYEVVI